MQSHLENTACPCIPDHRRTCSPWAGCGTFHAYMAHSGSSQLLSKVTDFGKYIIRVNSFIYCKRRTFTM